jgi:HAD superfamily hydrolase (TIGR01509 family)
MEKLTTNIKAIIFDMDGTIIQTEAVWKDVTIDILKQNNVTPTTEDDFRFLESLTGMNLFYSSAALKEKFNIQESVENLMQQAITQANIKMGENIKFIEGFEAFHQELQNFAILTGVATNAEQANLAYIAQKMDFQRFFGSNMYTPAHVNNKPKPDPSLFLHTAEQLGAQPHECLVFEDSLYGFTAAKGAGMKCIAIKNDQNKHLMEHVHDSINNYHEAEELLKKL